mmetsp:Transcript_7163/g.15628  ORF Transcript_7163/g.15628 Transcript_7163/m.15628 type:complete len:81 (+) Transcript_7163:745-987(+)
MLSTSRALELCISPSSSAPWRTLHLLAESNLSFCASSPQCHSMGTATVTTTWKQMAKSYCLKLQKFGLTSSIAPDSSNSG